MEEFEKDIFNSSEISSYTRLEQIDILLREIGISNNSNTHPLSKSIEGLNGTTDSI